MPSLRNLSDDPITRVLEPPPEETSEQREQRLRAEREAKRVNDEIDAQLREEHEKIKAAARRKWPAVRVLLLGQSESGKSTTLKNFQMMWASQSWKEERASWRSVVFLNIVKSTFNILSVLSDALTSTDCLSPNGFSQENLDALFEDLTAAETILKRRLSIGNGEPGDYRSGPIGGAGSELFVPCNVSWKSRFSMRMRKSNIGARPSIEINGDGYLPEKDEATDILTSRKSDIQTLWTSPMAQELLSRRGVRLEELPGFFLDDLDRILTNGYEPSDADVVRARLRTMGIQEHKFIFDKGAESGREWIIYDVGGSRPQVSTWFSFFEDVNAIIFIVPVNCFDEVLEEDPHVNRLQDSINLWKQICRSPLLKQAQLILFLNKVDLLQRKLDSGIHFAHYVPRFGDRANDRDTVCRYLRNQFKDIQKRYSPQRTFNAWLTCATDTKATEKTLATVRYGIVKDHLSDAILM
ncbi:G-alpha-domain-containing protein [Ramaria rubella]|nr:G-alpha-domain-containing protein [Ramaria rubella]